MAGKKGAKYKNPRATNPTKLNVTLTSVQQDIVVGTLLGDATMERAHENHNARLIMDQTFPTHAGYLTTLYVHLMNLVKTCPRVIIRKPDIRTGKRIALWCLKQWLYLVLQYSMNYSMLTVVKLCQIIFGIFLHLEH